MRRKYKYFVNDVEMSKKDFENELKLYCQKVVHTSYCGCIGVDFCEFDNKQFNSCMKDIQNGIRIITQGKTFKRKVVI